MSKSSKQTSTTKVDPAVMNAAMGNLQSAQDLAGSYKPYTGQLSADPNANLLASWEALGGLSGTGAGLLGQAATGAQNAMGYQPQQVTSPTMAAASYSPYVATAPQAGRASQIDLSQLGIDPSQLSTAGMVDRGSIRNVGVGAFNDQALAPFLNPATSQIVDAAMNDIERARTIQRNADSARMNNAWGGSRHGVADSLTNAEFQRTGASAAANLRGRAFDSAAGLLMQHLGLGLQADMANQGADLSVAGMNNQTGQFNAGQRNQGLFQSAAQRAQGLFANQDATNRRDEFNTGLLGTYGLAGMDAINQAGATNAGFQQQANQQNVNNQLQAALSNQSAGLQGAGLNLQGAGLLGELGTSALSLGNQAGLQQQQLEQDALSRLYQQYMDEWQTRMGLQQLQTGALGAVPTPTSTTAKSTPGLMDYLQTGANSALAAAALFSDERLKENIETAGFDAKGRRWVDYNYVWGPERYRGVLAQEILASDPEAVSEHESGYLMVDYSKLT